MNWHYKNYKPDSPWKTNQNNISGDTSLIKKFSEIYSQLENNSWTKSEKLKRKILNLSN